MYIGYSVPCCGGFYQFSNVCISSRCFLWLLLQSLDIFLPIKFILDGSWPFLLSQDCSLLLWIVIRILHLVHFRHGWVVGSRVSWAVGLNIHLLSKHRLGLNHVWLVVTKCHLFSLLLTQVDFDSWLWVANFVVVRHAALRAQVCTLHCRWTWLIVIIGSWLFLLGDDLLAFLLVVLVLLLDNLIGNRQACLGFFMQVFRFELLSGLVIIRILWIHLTWMTGSKLVLNRHSLSIFNKLALRIIHRFELLRLRCWLNMIQKFLAVSTLLSGDYAIHAAFALG